MSVRVGQVLATLIGLLVGMIFGLEVSGDAVAQPLTIASWSYDRPDHPAITASIQDGRGPPQVQLADHRMGVVSVTLGGAAPSHGLAKSAPAIYVDTVLSVPVDGHVAPSPKSERPEPLRRGRFGNEMQRGGVAAETATVGGTRLAQDIAVNPIAPRALPLNGTCQPV